MRIKQIRLKDGYESGSTHNTEDARGDLPSHARKRVWLDEASGYFVIAEAAQAAREWKIIPPMNVAWAVLPAEERFRFADPYGGEQPAQASPPPFRLQPMTPEEEAELARANGLEPPPIPGKAGRTPTGQFAPRAALAKAQARGGAQRLPPLDPNNLPE